MDETKICKYCKSEIPKNAKICPVCRKKQGSKLKTLLIVVAVIVVIMILISVLGGNTSKIDNSGSTSKSKTEDTSKTDEDNVVQIGGSFEDSGLKFTVTGAQTNFTFNDPYSLYQLDDGYMYVKVDFTFEDTGDSDQYVSIYDFDCYADNATCEQQFVTDVTGDFINTNLSSGRSVSFSTLYAVPSEASSIELEYSADLWSDDKVVVKIQ